VGAVSFQKKCLGKMEQATSGGRTVLFVSHNIGAVNALCQRAYLLEGGRIVESGTAVDVTRKYLAQFRVSDVSPLHERTDRAGDGSIRFTSLDVRSAEGGPVSSSSRLRITLSYESASELTSPRFLVTILDEDGNGVYRLDTHAEGGLPQTLPSRGTVTCLTDSIALTPGRCSFKVAAWRGGVMADQVEFAGTFDILGDAFYDTGQMPSRSSVVGLIRHRWELRGGDDGEGS